MTVDKILLGMSVDRSTTLRVNTIKYNIQDLMTQFKINNIKFDRVSWYNDGLVLKNKAEKDIQKLNIYNDGCIYIQSLSSMIPPLILSPKSGEKVLDLTAAPGSKTTQLAALMNNSGEIIANELDSIRYERLKYNIEKQGATIVQTINSRGEKIGEKYHEFFDKVLLDVPCSGEGRFIINEPKTYKDWSIKKVNNLVKLQKKLLTSAYKALKKNGVMVYSTCTINRYENELILDWGIKNLGLKIVDINLNIKDSIRGDNEKLDKSIDKSIKILPSKSMEGFFIAKLKKLY